jgi:hypothetical protein
VPLDLQPILREVWQLLVEVDDAYDVVGGLRTFF